MRSIEKSDIRRGQIHVGDSDGDGYADPVLHAGRAGDPIPGIDITRTAGGNAEGSGTQKREKMKKLKPTESEPLELMDETDTCPTLPCSTP